MVVSIRWKHFFQEREVGDSVDKQKLTSLGKNTKTNLKDSLQTLPVSIKWSKELIREKTDHSNYREKGFSDCPAAYKLYGDLQGCKFSEWSLMWLKFLMMQLLSDSCSCRWTFIISVSNPKISLVYQVGRWYSCYFGFLWVPFLRWMNRYWWWLWWWW